MGGEEERRRVFVVRGVDLACWRVDLRGVKFRGIVYRNLLVARR